MLNSDDLTLEAVLANDKVVLGQRVPITFASQVLEEAAAGDRTLGSYLEETAQLVMQTEYTNLDFFPFFPGEPRGVYRSRTTAGGSQSLSMSCSPRNDRTTILRELKIRKRRTRFSNSKRAHCQGFA